MGEYSAPMLNLFHSTMATRNLIEHFIVDASLLSGTSARNASWEGICHIDDGVFHHIDEWSENEGLELKQAIYSAQSTCGEKLGDEFMEVVPERYSVHHNEAVEVRK